MKDIEQHPNIDQLIVKPYLYFYADIGIKDDIIKNGLKVGESGMEVFFWRIPHNLPEWKDFLSKKVPIKISVSKLLKADQKFKVKTVNFDEDKFLTEDDIIELNKKVGDTHEEFKKGLDNVQKATLTSSDGMVPSFSFKDLSEGMKMIEKYTMLSEAVYDSDKTMILESGEAKKLGAAFTHFAKNLKGKIDVSPKDISPAVEKFVRKRMRSAEQIIRKEGIHKVINQITPMVKRAFPQVSNHNLTVRGIAVYTILMSYAKKTTPKTELLKLSQDPKMKAAMNVGDDDGGSENKRIITVMTYLLSAAVITFGVGIATNAAIPAAYWGGAAGFLASVVTAALLIVFMFIIITAVYDVA